MRRHLLRHTALVCWTMASLSWHAADAEETAATPKGEIVIAPYLWAPNLKGSVGLGGQTLPLNVKAQDLVGGVNAAAMGYVQFNRDQHFHYLEVFGLRFSDDQFQPLGGQRLDAELKLAEFGYGLHFDLASIWPVVGTTAVSPYIGIRYADLSATISNPQGSMRAGEKWVDPALGVLIEGPVYQQLSYTLKLDGAGFGLGTDHYWSGTSVLRYRFADAWSLAAGYRISRFKAKPGGNSNLALNVRGSGPDFGISYAFGY